MSEVDRKIQELTSEGRHDSQGTFTLDSTRAREKLYHFQLPERAYVLNLVASAIAGGATRLKFYQDADDVKLASNATGLSRGALANLFASPLADAGSKFDTAQLRELAIGLHGALAYQPRWIKLECDDGGNAYRLTLGADGEQKLEPVESSGVSFFRIHIKYPVTIMKALFATQSEMLESRYVAERCSLAPVEEFLLNGRPCRYALTMENPLIYRVATGPDAPRVGLVRAENGLRDKVVSERSFVLSLGDETDGPNLTVIHHGIAFEQTVDFEWPLRATVWCGDEFRKDLSQTAVVRGETWDALIKFLDEQAHELLEILWERADDLSEDERQRAQPLWARLAAQSPSLGPIPGMQTFCCPVCGCEEPAEEGRLLAQGAPLELESKDGTKTPVAVMGCSGCGHLWLKKEPEISV